MTSKALIALLFLVALPVHAEIVRIEVKSRADVLAGKAFGAAGPYEKLSGTIYFAVDPRNRANRIITDIDQAPRNGSGRVEFSSDFYLIKPKDPARGNGTLLYEVSNRGGKGMLGFFNFAQGNLDPRTAEQFGDGFLLERGFTLLWVGWQFDPPLRDGLVRVHAPMAREADGRPISGLVRSDFVVIETAKQASLADRDHQAYRSSPTIPRRSSRCAIRSRARAARSRASEWQFGDDGKSVRLNARASSRRRSTRSSTPPRIRRSSASVRPRSATPSRA